jgi:hypothetical protein
MLNNHPSINIYLYQVENTAIVLSIQIFGTRKRKRKKGKKKERERERQ